MYVLHKCRNPKPLSDMQMYCLKYTIIVRHTYVLFQIHNYCLKSRFIGKIHACRMDPSEQMEGYNLRYNLDGWIQFDG